MPAPDLRSLGRLVEEWRGAREVLRQIDALEAELASCDEPFVGHPLPEALVRGRLPAGIESAWVFVLRASHRNPAHQHPNSTQYTAVIRGSGIGCLGTQEVALRTFDAARPDETIYVIPRGTPHAFDTGNDGLVVLSFHTVAPERLVEIEVESAKRRTYVAGQ